MWKSSNHIFILDSIKYKASSNEFGTPNELYKTQRRVENSPVGTISVAKNLKLENDPIPGSLPVILSPHFNKFDSLPSECWESIRYAFYEKYTKQISDENLKYWRLKFLEKTIDNLSKEHETKKTKFVSEATKVKLRQIVVLNSDSEHIKLLKTIAIENCISTQTLKSQESFVNYDKHDVKKGGMHINDEAYFKSIFQKSFIRIKTKNGEFETLKHLFSERIHKVGEEIVREKFLRGSGRSKENLEKILLKEEVRKRLVEVCDEFSDPTKTNNVIFSIDDDEFDYIFEKLYEEGMDQTKISCNIVEEIAKRKHIEKIGFYLDTILSQNNWLDLIDEYTANHYENYSEEISDFADHEKAIEDIYKNYDEVNYGDIIFKVITTLHNIGKNKMKIKELDNKKIKIEIGKILDNKKIKNEIKELKNSIIEELETSKIKKLKSQQLKEIIESHPIL